MVTKCGGGRRRRRRRRRSPGYRIKNKNPTQRCGEIKGQMPSNAQSLYLRAIFSYLYDIFRYFPSFLWQTSRSKHIRQIFAGRCRKATSFSSMTPGRLHMEWEYWEPMKHHIQLGMKINNIKPMDVGYWMNQWYWMFFGDEHPISINIHPFTKLECYFLSAILWWFCFEEKEIKVWTHRP